VRGVLTIQLPVVRELLTVDGIRRQRDPLVGFALEDMEGAPVRPLTSRRTSVPNRGGGLLLVYEVTFPLRAGQPVPGRLVCRGPRLTALDIPFTLRDVPLTTRGTPALPR
jgi:hypothetical protein